MKKAVIYTINIVIVISIVVLALILKTGGFTLPLGKGILLSFRHLDNPLIIFLVFWSLRLILTRKPLRAVPSFSSKQKNIILKLTVLLWLGLKLFPYRFGTFSLYLPPFNHSLHPIITFILSCLLIGGIAYYIYLLAERTFGILAAIIAVATFLFSPLCRITTAALFPTYAILLFFLGSIVYFIRYLDPYKDNAGYLSSSTNKAGVNLIIGFSFLLSAFLFKYLWLGLNFKPQGLWDGVLFEQRLTTVLPLTGNPLLWIVPGIILSIRKRKSYLIFLLPLTFLWTFFIADNNGLASYLPLVCLLSIFSGACLNCLLKNRLTNRTTFDRNISFALTAALFILFYFNANSELARPLGSGFYEAENLSHYGRIVDDADASGGQAVLKEKEAAETQSMTTFGPYHRFLSGEYEVTFRLFVEDNTFPHPVIKIDVATDHGRTVFASKKIKGTDFKHKNVYEDFSLRFFIRKRRRLEFRVASYGGVNIKADRVSLSLLNRQELLSATRYIPILMYHKIGKEAPTQWWVKTKHFRKQMRKLKKAGYKSIRLKDIYDYKLKKRNLPLHPIVITFDDGYHNFLTEAFPILKKYGFTATIFIITDKTADNEEVRADNSWDHESESKYRTEHLIWPEIIRLAKKGIEIGSHTRTHPNLTRLEKVALKKEIKESKTILEEKLGMPVETFCYPGGRRNLLVIETVKETGYKIAVIVTPGIESTESPDLFNLKRICVGPGEDADKLLSRIARRE